MADTKIPKSSTTKGVEKQSLYQHIKSKIPLKSFILFELIVLAYGVLFWLLSGFEKISSFWITIGVGHALLLGSLLLEIRGYSALRVVQKMKEKSAAVEPRPRETVQEEAIDREEISLEFKIHATYAIDLPKLSANEQNVFDTLSRGLKMEYILWSVNIYLLLATVLLWLDWDTNFFWVEIIIFVFCIFRLAAIGTNMKGSVVIPIPRYLTTQEPFMLKFGLMLYMAFRALLSIVAGRTNTFSLITTISVFAITICISILVYGLRGQVRRLGIPAIHMLALWVFGTQNIWDLLEYLILPVWRKLGNIFLIRGGEHILRQVSLWDSLLFLRGKDRIISKTPEQITQRLNEFQKRTDRSPEYRFNTLICGDNSWQFALHSLIDHADLIVMHLSSFSPRNQGCIYELEQLINRVPVENFFLLVDHHSTDYNFLLEKLQELWKKMISNSPNQKEQSQGIQIIFLEHAVKTPDEVEAIYANMHVLQQDAMNVLADERNKELVTQHETRKRQELEGLFRVLFAKAVQLSRTFETNTSLK